MISAGYTKLLRVLALAPLFTLAGCGDAIQYNGKVFDVLGVNGTTKPKDARVIDRAPLVLPPDTSRLPAPGSESATIAEQGLPDDVDRRSHALKAEAEKKKLKDREFKSVVDPTAEPRPGILDRLIKGKKKTEDEDVADVPEPDPSDEAAPAPKTRTSAR